MTQEQELARVSEAMSAEARQLCERHGGGQAVIIRPLEGMIAIGVAGPDAFQMLQLFAKVVSTLLEGMEPLQPRQADVHIAPPAGGHPN